MVYGVYSYSKRIKASLNEEFSPLQLKIEGRLETEVPLEETPQRATSFNPQKSVRENTLPVSNKTDAAPECKHYFGYLRTLPKNISVPNECLSCDRIIKCKHSLATALENRVTS